jgi:hypothetical protein
MQNKGALTQYSLAAREILMLRSDTSLFSADVVSPTGDNLPLSADMFSIMTDTLLLTLPAPGKCTLDIK